MTSVNVKADALHVATYSGWYRFEQHNGQWTQTDKALTFWKMTALQVDPNDPRHIYIATEHSGLFITANGGAEYQKSTSQFPLAGVVINSQAAQTFYPRVVFRYQKNLIKTIT